jgi:hypothetical protein
MLKVFYVVNNLGKGKRNEGEKVKLPLWEVWLHAFLTSVLDGGVVSFTSRALYSGRKSPRLSSSTVYILH